MTTQRKYECNLCREAVLSDPPPNAAPGYGIKFTMDSEWLQLEPPSAAENHICGKCLTALRALKAGKP